MLHTNSITNAVYTILSSDSTMVNCGVHLDLYGDMEGKVGRTPWVGVVPGPFGIDTEYEPRRANIHSPWTAVINIPVVIQTTARRKLDGMQKLDGLQAVVMSAVNCAESGRRTLMGTVDIITGFSVVALDRETLEGLFFMRQFNIIAEVLT